MPSTLAVKCSFLTRTTALLFACLLLYGADARAGWYRVTNYEGHVGQYPVHLSIQEYDFGNGLDIHGSYYYDSKRQSILLYGKRTNTGELVLCEIHGSEEFDKVIIHGSAAPINVSDCPFRLKSADHSLNGNWADRGKIYDVALEKTGTFDNNIEDSHISGKMEIPFWGQTSRHSFIGVYSLQGGEARVNVKVVNKVTGRTIQELRIDENRCAFGFVMTSIYLNIETFKERSEQIFVRCGGKPDYSEYRFKKAVNRFVLVALKK